MKKFISFSKTAVIIAFLIGCASSVFLNESRFELNAKTPAEPIKWEYLVADGACGMSGVDNKKTIELMNKYGSEGWEYVNYIGSSCKFVMKRPAK